MPATTCPVVGCTAAAHQAFETDRVGPDRRVAVTVCALRALRIGEGRERVAVEYRPPISRWPALVRVTIGEPRRIGQRPAWRADPNR